MVTADYPPMPGGQARFLADVWGRLPADQVRVLAPAGGSFSDPAVLGALNAPRTALEHGYPSAVLVRRIGVPMGSGLLSRAAKVSRLTAACLAECRSRRPRLVCGGQATGGGIAAWAAHRAFGVPYALVVHGGEVLDWPGPRALLRRVVGQARLIVCNSEHTRRVVAEASLGAGEPRLEVLHPPLPAALFDRFPDRAEARRRLGIETDEVVLLTVARLVVRKRVDLVLEALHGMGASRRRIRYLVVGDGPRRGALEAQAAELGLREAVRFEGHVPDSLLATYYAASDVFVMPAFAAGGDFEGFGIVYVEAQAAGLPVVAARDGGAPEAVLDGETALLVDNPDPGEIAAALGRLAEDAGLRARLGARGREWARRAFDPAVQSARLWRLLEDS